MPRHLPSTVRAGWPETAVDALKARSWGNFSKIVAALPAGFKRIRDGDTLTIGSRRWTIVTGCGHSPEHSCLVSDGVMISGDQVLPSHNEPFTGLHWLEERGKLKRLTGADGADRFVAA